MCLTMDANAALSQLSYEPKSTLFIRKKVGEFGFLKYSIFRGKVQRIGLKNGATNLGRMCLAMDANAALSQLSYESVCNFRQK